MKKIASLLLLLIALTSCEEEITRNNPAFQGLRDNVMWRAVNSGATIDGVGSLYISGADDTESLVLRTRFATPGTYILGLGELRKATFVDANGDTYATGTNEGDGEVVITEFDEINRTVTGTFRFNAVKVDGDTLTHPVLNFQQGVFYKVPISQTLEQ